MSPRTAIHAIILVLSGNVHFAAQAGEWKGADVPGTGEATYWGGQFWWSGSSPSGGESASYLRNAQRMGVISFGDFNPIGVLNTEGPMIPRGLPIAQNRSAVVEGTYAFDFNPFNVLGGRPADYELGFTTEENIYGLIVGLNSPGSLRLTGNGTLRTDSTLILDSSSVTVDGLQTMWEESNYIDVRNHSEVIVTSGTLNGSVYVSDPTSALTVRGSNARQDGLIGMIKGTVEIAENAESDGGAYAKVYSGGGSLSVTTGGYLTVDRLEALGPVHVTGSTSILEVDGTLSIGGAGIDPAPTVTVNSGQLYAGEIELINGGELVYQNGAVTVGDFDGLPSDNWVTLYRNGMLSGTGTVRGNVLAVGGTVSPGASPGTLQISGDLVFSGDATLLMETEGFAEGAQSDRLVVAGDATLGGSLLLTFANGFAPRKGDVLDLIQVDGELSGDFASIQFGNLLPGFEYSTDFSNDTYSLTALNDAFSTVSRPGDYDQNGVIDASDIDMLAEAIREFSTEGKYDLNSSGSVDRGDRSIMVKNLLHTWFGDANLDGEFDTSDMVQVFAAGKYETTVAVGWAQGDWDGNGVFDSADMVTAFADGGYEQGRRTDAAAVPEPNGCVVLILGIVLTAAGRTRKD